MKKGTWNIVVSYSNPHFKKGKSRTVFTVCGIEGFNYKRGDRHRTFGWFAKSRDAIEAVLRNDGEIYEYSHTYVVVEEIKEGIFGLGIKEWWFKWDTKNGRYLPTEKPKESKGIVNWGL